MHDTVVLIGAGGIGAPAAIALGEAGLRRLLVVDDDRVELSNLHRQLLFERVHVGAPKLATFCAVLRQRYPAMSVQAQPGKATADNALALAQQGAVVIDATDNFASRFLLADACHLAGTAVVHAAAVRWRATVMTCAAAGKPCYRCLFEDIPAAAGIDCSSAGVLAPVCGVAGALAADRALRLLAGDADAAGHIISYDGHRDRLRAVPISARAECALCSAQPAIGSLRASRYTNPASCRLPALVSG